MFYPYGFDYAGSWLSTDISYLLKKILYIFYRRTYFFATLSVIILLNVDGNDSHLIAQLLTN